MSRLRITRLGHGGVLYQSPGDKWIWVDRWSGAPTYVAPLEPWQVDVVAPTHGHFDHVGDDATDVVELAGSGWPGDWLARAEPVPRARRTSRRSA